MSRLGALRLNLSYVLHEPSTSPVVDRMARVILLQRRRTELATARMTRWRDEDFIPRIVFRDETAIWAFQRDRVPCILSIDLGATELLQRALRLIMPLTAPSITVSLVDRPDDSSSATTVPLFRGSASLFLPSASEIPCWFAVLVFRPGWRSVLLDLVRLSGDHPLMELVGAIERALRDYTDQWWGWRPWWERPAEEVLPELQESRWACS